MNIPSDFIALMTEQLGDEATALLDSVLLPQCPSIRYNPAKFLPETITDGVAWEQDAAYKDISSLFATDPLWHGGAYYVQESSSMFLGYIVKQLGFNQQPCVALDLCAAPGGKTTHLLQSLHPDSLVIANEIIPKRNSVLRENLMRWGSANIIVTQSELYKWKNSTFKADLVLIDAPCSGEGLWRKQNAAVQEWSLSQVQVCASRQKEILDVSMGLVKDGGYLIYSTCTYNSYEDEQQLQYILSHEDYDSVEILHAFEGIVSSTSPFSYKFYTHKVKGSGFFIAVFQKKSKSVAKLNSYSSLCRQNFSVTENHILLNYIKDKKQYVLLNFQESLFQFPKQYVEELYTISQFLYIKSVGVEVAKIFSETKVHYAHAFALSLNIDKDKFPIYKTTYKEAISYLKKNDIILEQKFMEGEYVLMTYNDVAIGWAKALQGRLKNLLPIPLRLRNG
jgi:16S rRNA C967 or C1407 C5-methylase (RsmB/RsmF family)/NOL1/NOP2/fmu family ribosome biogenesis protein